MFSFLRRGRSAESGRPRPVLGWDLHCHLLPGMDDGVRTKEEAIEAVRALQRAGYRGSVLTPHVYKGLYDNSREGLLDAVAALRATLADAGIEHPVHLAAEYFADETLAERVGREPLLSFGPKERPHVLIEFPYMSEPLLWADALGALVRGGYQPVIAHPERYRFVAQQLELWLERFGAYGAVYQSNVGALVGQYGPEAQATARALLERDVPTFWGSDLHRPSQVDRFILPGLSHLGGLGVLNPQLAGWHDGG